MKFPRATRQPSLPLSEWHMNTNGEFKQHALSLDRHKAE